MDNFWLDVLGWICLLMAAILFIMSTMSVGKHAYDLYYQLIKGLNGIRKIQSWINIRTHGNRVFFALWVIIILVLRLFEADLEARMWVSTLGFFLLLFVYMLASILDWKAEAKQLKILIAFEEKNNVSQMRVTVHALNSLLTEYFGVVQFMNKPTQEAEESVEQLQQQIKAMTKSIQHDLHEMDPTYAEVKHANATK